MLALLQLLAGAPAGATEAPDTEASAVASRPPELIASVPAIYPDEARALGIEATVSLRLTIAVDGTVESAEVMTPAGHGMDEAARTAALQFRFRPAERRGVPVKSRLTYRVVFAPDTPAPVSANVPPEAPPVTIDVQVRGERPAATVKRESAEAVNVVELGQAARESADMGEVLARSSSVALRSASGLGGTFRLSLGGLYDDQIRVYVDGVPIEASAFPNGVANVPVNLVERIDIYRGIVPTRYGADALGGALDLVTYPRKQTRLAASYQVGSFGTHRLNVDGSFHDPSSGFVAGGAAYLDVTDNDYRIDVQVADSAGQLTDARVRRFHDGYSARGGMVTVGVVDKAWARRLTLEGFASGFDKELQHNIVMTVPYGEVDYGGTTAGATLRYVNDFSDALTLESLATYAHRSTRFVDDSRFIYDWRGERVGERRIAGEIEGSPIDQTIGQDTLLARATMSFRPAPGHIVRLTGAPTRSTREGRDRTITDENAIDPLARPQTHFTLVIGLEYEANLWPSAAIADSTRLQNIVFVKDYVYRASSDEVGVGGETTELTRRAHGLGVGDSARVWLTPWLLAKVAYEYARRLPSVDEVFGNGVLIAANTGLEPEVSHNVNAGPRATLRGSLGDFTADVNGFARYSDKLIVLLGNERFFRYQNVYAARIIGVETTTDWTSPARLVSVGASFTVQDARNVSSRGTFGDFDGDRLPNRPWLFASWYARALFEDVGVRGLSIAPFYHGRYVHGFYRGWESQGDRAFKQTVDAQVAHDVGVTVPVSVSSTAFAATLEARNVTDARLYDFFGVQRPGRAVYLKLTAEWR